MDIPLWLNLGLETLNPNFKEKEALFVPYLIKMRVHYTQDIFSDWICKPVYSKMQAFS